MIEVISSSVISPVKWSSPMIANSQVTGSASQTYYFYYYYYYLLPVSERTVIIVYIVTAHIGTRGACVDAGMRSRTIDLTTGQTTTMNIVDSRNGGKIRGR